MATIKIISQGDGTPTYSVYNVYGECLVNLKGRLALDHWLKQYGYTITEIECNGVQYAEQ